MIVISLVAVALSALSALAFRPPAFCAGCMTAVHARTTVVMYIDNYDSKDQLIAKLEAENLNLHFKRISNKLDHLDRKLDHLDPKIATELKTDIKMMSKDLKTDNKMKMMWNKLDHLDRKVDYLDCKLDNIVKDLKTDIKAVSKDVSTLKIGLAVIACLCVAPLLSTILAFFKH